MTTPAKSKVGVPEPPNGLRRANGQCMLCTRWRKVRSLATRQTGYCEKCRANMNRINWRFGEHQRGRIKELRTNAYWSIPSSLLGVLPIIRQLSRW